MALNRTVVKPQWTLLAADITELTFQVVSSDFVYIGFSSSSDSPPVEDFGLLYGIGDGELKKLISEMSYKPNVNCIWAKSVSGRDETVVVETG